MEAPSPSFSSSVFARAEYWFLRAKSSLLGSIPCRKGCQRCCIGPFAITVLDVDELQRGLQMIPVETRKQIEERARRQVAAIEARYPYLAADPIVDDCPNDQIDQLVTHFADVPCPALQDDGRAARCMNFVL
jgi:hypothetical protein